MHLKNQELITPIVQKPESVNNLLCLSIEGPSLEEFK